jgi:hypothetical protein
MVDVAILELAIREGKLLGSRIDKKRAVYKHTIVEPREIQTRREIESPAVIDFLPENALFAEIDVTHRLSLPTVNERGDLQRRSLP